MCEEKIAHKLRFDGEAGWVREAERVRGAAWAEESNAAIDPKNVE